MKLDNVCNDVHLQHITRVSSGPAAWHGSSVACCAVPGSVTGMGAGVVGESRVAVTPMHNDNGNDGHLQHITRVSSGPAAWHSSSVACCAVPGSVTGMGAGVVGENWVAGDAGVLEQ